MQKGSQQAFNFRNNAVEPELIDVRSALSVQKSVPPLLAKKDSQQCRHTPHKKSRRGFSIGRQQYGCSKNYILDWVYKDELVRTSLVSTRTSSTNVARYCISETQASSSVCGGTLQS